MKKFFTEIDACGDCKLWRSCGSPKMEATGDNEKRIFVLAEAPGKLEDEKGEQLVGRAGQFLRDELKKLGIDLDRDCRKLNSVNCRPENNRTPSSTEISACRNRVWKALREANPRLVLLLGSPALESFLGHRWPGGLGGIGKWRKWAIPDREVNAWAVPLYHPSYIVGKDKQGVAYEVFKQDLDFAISYSTQSMLDYVDERSQIELLNTENEIKEILEQIYRIANKEMLLSFDWETNSLKPYNQGAEIVCCSICIEENKGYAFMMPEEGTKTMTWLKRILRTKKIAKTAHNIKFEDTWTKVKLGVDVGGWKWCSMQATHVLDNRVGINGLDFQLYVNFGTPDYYSTIQPYLKSTDERGFNRVRQVPEKELMIYCGVDSLGGWRLAKKQMEKMKI